MSVADPRLYRTVQQELYDRAVSFIGQNTARAHSHELAKFAEWGSTTNICFVSSADIALRGNETGGDNRESSHVWLPSKLPF